MKHKDEIKKILIRSVNWIGDAVMTTPALSMIRKSFPAAEIVMLANPLVSELFLHHPDIDRVITFNPKVEGKGLKANISLAARLKKERFDMAIILPNSFGSAVAPWLAAIPRRLGKSSDGRTLLLTDRYRLPQNIWTKHEVDYYIHLLNNFGINGEKKSPHLSITEEERASAAITLENGKIGANDFVVGINPGATFGSAKRWYPERFAAVATTFITKHNAKIVIFGSSAEKAMGDEIEKSLPDGSYINLAGKTTVRELMALIARCNLFITNDSGPMHIAAAFKVPLVAIFGSTDHKGTAPLSDKSVIVRKDVECAPCKLRECPSEHRCMTSVTAEDVVEAATILLQETLY